jgi:hypothetical protein
MDGVKSPGVTAHCMAVVEKNALWRRQNAMDKIFQELRHAAKVEENAKKRKKKCIDASRVRIHSTR